ncbi:MAG: hypothetical protein IRY94_21065, partial [Rhodospirillaceae bacterium]|nr:hypothetical protein [Rhodospirillaceae bacterium]
LDRADLKATLAEAAALPAVSASLPLAPAAASAAPAVVAPRLSVVREPPAPRPSALVLASAASLLDQPDLPTGLNAVLLAAGIDAEAVRAAAAPHRSNLAAAPEREAEAGTPATGDDAGRVALADDVVASVPPSGDNRPDEGDVAVAPGAIKTPADEVAVATAESGLAAQPDAAAVPANAAPSRTDADALGATSYKQAGIESGGAASLDAVQTLMEQAQSLLEEAGRTQQTPGGAGGVQTAMVEPAVPAQAALDLGGFRRDPVPPGAAPRGPGLAPDAQTLRGEGIRGGSVVLDSVEYDERGDVVIGGAATPNAPLNIYIDNEHVGSAIASPGGRWSVVPSKPLSEGVHYLRVDQVEAGGRVVARVESPFARVEPIAVESGDTRVVVQPGN